MKKLLIALCLLPLVGVACDDENNPKLPDVAGDYQVLKTDCSFQATSLKVTQDGEDIELVFKEKAADVYLGKVEEDADFEVTLGNAKCSGRFKDTGEFDINCNFGNESCTYAIELQ